MEHAGKLAVVAVGGNALIRDKHHESIPDQSREAALTVHHIADMIAAGWNVVITHGTGPQVGFILRRSELALEEVPPVPMDYADADLQGGIGYMFLKALYNEFHTQHLDRKAVAIVTQTLVDHHDPAFADPSKPIGSHMDEQTARRLASRQGWVVKEDAGRGWRRVVPSPLPKTIVELAAIKTLARAGFVVIACGGGGIPVIENEEGGLTGVEAVIDKDLASSLLARGIGADLLMVSTGVEKVAINFNRPNQQWLDRMTLADAKRHLADNQFDKGSMGPKIQAVIEFLEGGGRMG
ncbi:MAG: carbamate kinase, partial [Nitrospira sp.]|nr:carbamate kinase [Nitrospira sp.]